MKKFTEIIEVNVSFSRKMREVYEQKWERREDVRPFFNKFDTLDERNLSYRKNVNNTFFGLGNVEIRN